jgi:hypothetical protein
VRRRLTEHSRLLIVLATALVIRLALASLPGFESDVGLATSQALAIVVCTAFAALLVETKRLARGAAGTMSVPTPSEGG